ncbi:ethionine resistance protein [Blastocladiella emersonii ATCC 22665]|nr:ethionine resistance protein [Blastocladiella emersonii ATCC 22665]
MATDHSLLESAAPAPLTPLRAILYEARQLTRLAVPCIGSTLLNYANRFVPTLLVGRLGAPELAATTLAVMFANVAGFPIFFGLASALDTLAAQAVTGASDKSLVGVYLQRAVVVNLAVAVPLSAAWFTAAPLLVLAGQDPELAARAGTYLRYLWIGLLPMIISNCVSKFLVAQNRARAPFAASLAALPVNVGLGYLLAFHTPLGMYGTAVASVVAEWITAVALTVYAARVSPYWPSFATLRAAAAPAGLRAYLALGVPGALITAAEWWVYELVALVAGAVGGTRALAAHAVVLQWTTVLHMLFSGTAVAAAARVGMQLGAGDAAGARRAAGCAVALAVATGAVTATCVLALRDPLARVFVREDDVVALAASLFPILAAFQCAEAAECAATGVLRGCGRQKIGAAIGLAGYYAVGMPTGIALTLAAGFGIKGMWIGLGVALYACVAAQGVYFWRWLDWAEEVGKAKARTQE